MAREQQVRTTRMRLHAPGMALVRLEGHWRRAVHLGRPWSEAHEGAGRALAVVNRDFPVLRGHGFCLGQRDPPPYWIGSLRPASPAWSGLVFLR